MNKALYDNKGKEICEFDVIKVFHFIGARGKKHYMYKWVKKHISTGKLVAWHLTSEDGYYFLFPLADENGVLSDTEIVQSYE